MIEQPMTLIEKKEQLFELYIDDLRFLGAEIPYLHWGITNDGEIYLLWDKINDDVDNHHLQYSNLYRTKLDEFVNYFNLTHQITDEDL
jgi:hypothetical protein